MRRGQILDMIQTLCEKELLMNWISGIKEKSRMTPIFFGPRGWKCRVAVDLSWGRQ